MALSLRMPSLSCRRAGADVLALCLAAALLPTRAPPPPLPPVGGQCRKPPVNPRCFGEDGQPSAEVCCGDRPPESCWPGFQTARRCCPAEALPAPPECDDGDLQLLAALNEYFQTGSLPPQLPAAPSARALLAKLGASAWDDEIDRCPAAVLARLGAEAELLAAAGGVGEEASQAYFLAVSLAHLLQGAAVARGSLSRSPHRYPASVVYHALNRARVAYAMHRDPRTFLGYLLDLADVDSQSALSSCIPKMHLFQKCMRFTKRSGKDPLLMLELLRAEPHARSVVAKAPDEGRLAVSLAQLHGAVTLQGIRDLASGTFFRAATASVRETARSSARATSFRLGTRARLAVALTASLSDLANNTVRNYTESEVGKESLMMDLLHHVGTKSKFFVELGVGDGSECNSRHLRQHHRWRGIMLDQMFSNPGIGLHRRFLTVTNFNDVLEDLGVPEEFDLLSMDVDGNDFWLWLTLRDRFRPRVVMVEYVKTFGAEDVLTRYAPSGLSFVRGDFWHLPLVGASMTALVALGRAKGYRLAGIVSGYDLLFVRADLLPEASEVPVPELPSVPAVGKLLVGGEFHVTSSEALGRPMADSTVHPAWTAACLEERMAALCQDDEVGKLCY